MPTPSKAARRDPLRLFSVPNASQAKCCREVMTWQIIQSAASMDPRISPTKLPARFTAEVGGTPNKFLRDLCVSAVELFVENPCCNCLALGSLQRGSEIGN